MSVLASLSFLSLSFPPKDIAAGCVGQKLDLLAAVLEHSSPPFPPSSLISTNISNASYCFASSSSSSSSSASPTFFPPLAPSSSVTCPSSPAPLPHPAAAAVSALASSPSCSFFCILYLAFLLFLFCFLFLLLLCLVMCGEAVCSSCTHCSCCKRQSVKSPMQNCMMMMRRKRKRKRLGKKRKRKKKKEEEEERDLEQADRREWGSNKKPTERCLTAVFSFLLLLPFSSVLS